MSCNMSQIGSGNAMALMQSRMANAQSCAQSSGTGSFSSAVAQASSKVSDMLATASSPESVQKRQEALTSLKSLYQDYQSGANISQAAQSLSGNSYASINDYLQALSQTAGQSVSTGSSISTTA
ncbi:MAG: hypothetical protein P4L77_01495 [Sulfuriferula sp.]|nr:hypothetical protein [Sulfuriferula sp.]